MNFTHLVSLCVIWLRCSLQCHDDMKSVFSVSNCLYNFAFLVLFEIELVSFVDQAASDEFSEFPTVRNVCDIIIRSLVFFKASA